MPRRCATTAASRIKLMSDEEDGRVDHVCTGSKNARKKPLHIACAPAQKIDSVFLFIFSFCALATCTLLQGGLQRGSQAELRLATCSQIPLSLFLPKSFLLVRNKVSRETLRSGHTCAPFQPAKSQKALFGGPRQAVSLPPPQDTSPLRGTLESSLRSPAEARETRVSRRPPTKMK